MSWTVGGAAAGAIYGSLPGGVAVLAGLEIGATIGALIDGLTAKAPQVYGDTRYSSVSYGSPINRVWGAARLDCQVIWVSRNSDGTYMTEHDGASKKKGQPQQRYHATYAFNIAETGFTFPDGSQVERPLIIDRIRMADKIVYTNPTATPIGGWVNTTTYNYGDYVSIGGSSGSSGIAGDYAPAYNPAATYAVGNVVLYQGYFYICTSVPPVGFLYPKLANWAGGPLGFDGTFSGYRRAYSATYPYAVGQLITLNGRSYVCVAESGKGILSINIRQP